MSFLWRNVDALCCSESTCLLLATPHRRVVPTKYTQFYPHTLLSAAGSHPRELALLAKLTIGRLIQAQALLETRDHLRTHTQRALQQHSLKCKSGCSVALWGKKKEQKIASTYLHNFIVYSLLLLAYKVTKLLQR